MEHLKPENRQMNRSVNPHRSAALRRFAASILLLVMANASMAAPDYSAFDELLLQNVRNGFVDYAGIEANPQFRRFVQQVGETDAGSLPYPNSLFTSIAHL